MCDIVLSSDDAYFQDMAHLPRNLSPGDGVQNIWPLVMGAIVSLCAVDGPEDHRPDGPRLGRRE
jgi:hypothetical protein